MDNLYIDYEQGVILGNKIYEKAKQINELLNKIDTIQNKLSNELNIKIDTNIQNELLTRIKVMNKLKDVVEETGLFLINVSNAYQETINISENNRGDKVE